MAPKDLDCVIAYCDNPTVHVNDKNSFNFTWDGNRTKLGESIRYTCAKDDTGEQMRLHGDVLLKSNAAKSVDVKCGDDGEWIYPEKWPTCLKTVTCDAPPDVSKESKK